MIVSFHKNIILRFKEIHRDRAVVGGDDGSRNASTVTKKKKTPPSLTFPSRLTKCKNNAIVFFELIK